MSCYDQVELEQWYSNDESLYSEANRVRTPEALKSVVEFWLETSEADIDLTNVDFKELYEYVNEP